MVTAMQSARIKAIQGLVTAREALPPVSLVCFGRAHTDSIRAVINQIDWLLGELVPNEPLNNEAGGVEQWMS